MNLKIDNFLQSKEITIFYGLYQMCQPKQPVGPDRDLPPSTNFSTHLVSKTALFNSPYRVYKREILYNTEDNLGRPLMTCKFQVETNSFEKLTLIFSIFKYNLLTFDKNQPGKSHFFIVLLQQHLL